MDGKVFEVRQIPLLWPVLLWTTGLALSRGDGLPLIAACFLLLICLVILLYFRKGVLVLILCAGAVWGLADLLLDARAVTVDESWLGERMDITATIERVERYGGYSRLLIGRVVRADSDSITGKALLYSYGKRQPFFQTGQRIAANVSWRLPRNYLNPGSFDYRDWCFDQGIALIGSSRGAASVLSNPELVLEQMRYRIRTAVLNHDTQEAGVLQAILLGDRSRIDNAVRQDFAATGTAHLLAISGMHVGMVAACVFTLVWWLLTRREGWIVHLPVRKVALSVGMLAAMAYAVIAGLPLPAQRALMMLMAGVLAWLLATRAQPLNTMLAALFLILLFDPGAVVSLSLWLSFVATTAIVLWASLLPGDESEQKNITRLFTVMRSLLWISMLAALATLPLVVATFGSVPVYTLPANLILVPIYGLIVLPLGLLGELAAILGMDGLASTLMGVSCMAIEVSTTVLEWLVLLPMGRLWAIASPLWVGLIYVAGCILTGWWLYKGYRERAALMVCFALLFYLVAVLPERSVDAATWVVWDVGQGASSALLLPGNHIVAIDAPGRSGSSFNGGTTAAAGLRSLGITHVDVLILSHAQSDHLGGALSLMQRLNKTGEIWLPDVPTVRAHHTVKSIITYAQRHGVRLRWLARGDSITGPDAAYAISVLWPPLGFRPANHNNASLVLRLVVDGGKRLLLPGDIEQQPERVLLAEGLEPVDTMLIPHHGSRTSMHADFVEQLAPELAIAQAGLANHYGFPDPQVVATYQAVGTVVKQSAEGAVIVDLSANKLVDGLSQWREKSGSRRDIVCDWWRSYDAY